jgi:hypothetical protein
MEMFSKDELGLIAFDLDIESLSNFCQTSKYINSKVGINNDFWANKLKKDFDINFFVEHAFPKSARLREKYLKTVPAKAEYLKYSKLVEGKPINNVLGEGIKKNDLIIIKIALSRGATYQTDFFSDMLEMENYNRLLNISMDYWMNNKENVIKIIKDILNLLDFNTLDKKAKLGMILYDIYLPRAVKFLGYHENFWVNAFNKFKEFRDVFPEFQELYIRREQLYKQLAEQ